MQKELSVIEVKWTWADLVSSYRFWALFIFFIIVMYIKLALPSVLIGFMNIENFQAERISVLLQISKYFIMISIIPAWLFSRVKNGYPLYVSASLILVGLLLMYCFAQSTSLLSLGLVLVSFFIGVISLLVPAYLARAVDSAEVFILSYGVMIALLFINDVIFSGTIGFALRYLGADPFLIIMNLIIMLVIGIVFLAFMKVCLFNESPRLREVNPQTPRYLNSILVFFLFFIPFYFIFWFYRTHKDIRAFSQSPTLLTPKGAAFSSFFVPFGTFVMFAILNDNIHQLLFDKDKKSSFKTWLIILLGIFLPPIAAAMVQSKMNQLMDLNKNTDTAVAY